MGRRQRLSARKAVCRAPGRRLACWCSSNCPSHQCRHARHRPRGRPHQTQAQNQDENKAYTIISPQRRSDNRRRARARARKRKRTSLACPRARQSREQSGTGACGWGRWRGRGRRGRRGRAARGCRVRRSGLVDFACVAPMGLYGGRRADAASGHGNVTWRAATCALVRRSAYAPELREARGKNKRGRRGDETFCRLHDYAKRGRNQSRGKEGLVYRPKGQDPRPVVALRGEELVQYNSLSKVPPPGLLFAPRIMPPSWMKAIGVRIQVMVYRSQRRMSPRPSSRRPTRSSNRTQVRCRKMSSCPLPARPSTRHALAAQSKPTASPGESE